jgi:hypothetical protein
MYKKVFMIIVSLCMLVVGTYAQDKPSDQPVVKIEASSSVLELLKTWDKKWLFITPLDKPIRSLEGLTRNDFACWGDNTCFKIMNSLFEILGVKGEGVNMMGDGAYKKATNKPPLYVTTSYYASDFKGVARVLFVEKKSSTLSPQPPEVKKGSANVSIVGRVLNKDKMPVKDLRLQMAEGEVKDGKLIFTYTYKTNNLKASTDLSGRFQFSNVPTGKWAISVVYGSALTDDSGNPVLIVVEESSSTIIDVGDITRR